MTVLNVEQVSNGDFYRIDYESDLDAIRHLIADKMGYDRSLLTWGATQSHWNNGDWQSCREAPEQYRVEEGTSPDFLLHAIIRSNSWELGDAGIVSLRSKMTQALCVWVENDGDETIHVETHPVGTCPHVQYYKDVMTKFNLKVMKTFYVSFSGADENDVVKDMMTKKIKTYLDDMVYSIVEDLSTDIEWELDHDNYELDHRAHSVQVQEVRRIPGG